MNNDYAYYKASKPRQETYTKTSDTCKDSTFFSSGSTVLVQMEDGGPWTHDMVLESNR